jgi:hypothetical protein
MATLPEHIKKSVLSKVKGEHPGVKVSVSFGRARDVVSPTGRKMIICDNVSMKAKGYRDTVKHLSYDKKDGWWRLV